MNLAQLRFLSILVLLLLVVSTGIAQPPTSAAKAPARISGRVTIDGQPAQGVEVVLFRDNDYRRMEMGVGILALPTATTDAEGRYKFSDLAAGGYHVTAHAPAYVMQTDRRRRRDSGKGVNIAENENLENVDLSMMRGGVVTGKVTDEDGRPVIVESVTIFRLDQQGKRIETDAFDPFGREETDDQGIFRIFGIEAGRYLVAAGSSPEEINTASALAQRSTGIITGRVVTEDGQPVMHATISISSMGGGPGGRRAGRLTVVSDEDGNFQAEGLDSVPYTITATAPGYVLAPNKRRETNYSFAGQTVTVTMLRGGVITGKVTSATGQPLIRIPVRAIRVRDESGLPDNTAVGNFRPQRTTDDRGIYRLYGLAPGYYLVSAGGSIQNALNQATPYHGRIVMYYPSATRDAATEVKLIGGDEVRGIDIRYRGESGFAISGKILVASSRGGGSQDTGTNISLLPRALQGLRARSSRPRTPDCRRACACI